MNTKRTRITPKRLLLPISLAVASSAYGFQYSTMDVVLGFRYGQNNTEPQLVVDAGSVTKFLSLSAGQTITLTNVATQLTGVNGYPDLNNVAWSAAAHMNNTGNTNYPQDTLWVTSPRADLNTQTAPWQRKSQFTQMQAGSSIEGIGTAAANWGNANPSAPGNLTSSIFIPPSATTVLYSSFVDNANWVGNFNGCFQGNVETTTPYDFDTAGTPVRADCYQLLPGSGNGQYLGYFQFSPDGTMTFTAGQAAVVIAPFSVTVTRAGTATTVSFPTVSGANYSLLYADSTGLGLPVSGWTASGSPVAGDGTTKSLTDVTATTARFYKVIATPQ